jgi:hypothetical protein
VLLRVDLERFKKMIEGRGAETGGYGDRVGSLRPFMNGSQASLWGL